MATPSNCQYAYLTLMRMLNLEATSANSIAYIKTFNRYVPSCTDATSDNIDRDVVELLKDAKKELDLYVDARCLNDITEFNFAVSERRAIQAFVHSRYWHKHALYAAMDMRTRMIYHQKEMTIGSTILATMWLVRRLMI